MRHDSKNCPRAARVFSFLIQNAKKKKKKLEFSEEKVSKEEENLFESVVNPLRSFDLVVYLAFEGETSRCTCPLWLNGDSIARIKGGKRGKRSDWQVVG